MDALNQAAEWLERGSPEEQRAAEETAAFGERIWDGAGGVRAYARTDADAFRLRVIGGDGAALVYELPGVDGAWLR